MTSKLFDSPLQSIVFRNVVSMTSRWVEWWTLYILRNRHEDVHIVGYASFLVVAFYFDNETNFSCWWSFNYHVNREQRLNSDIQSITHEFELSIRRDKSHQSFILETTESDTLMELDIIELNSFVFRCSSLSLVVSLVIESQLQIRHSR